MPSFLPGPLVSRLASASIEDSELLRRVVDIRCEEAFKELVRRYGPMVYGVCRRTLVDHHLSEDAFQAAFFVLAQKAHTIRPANAIAGWLYGVARKAALEAADMRRRKCRELLPGVLPERPADAHTPDDSAELLHAAIAELPEVLRSAVLLCEIEGLSRAIAAVRLGIAEGTLSSRLAAARKTLASRLRCRGVVLSTFMMASVLLPARLARAAVQSARGKAPSTVIEISQGVIRTMSLTKLKLIPPAILCTIMVLGGFALLCTTPTSAAPVLKGTTNMRAIVVPVPSTLAPVPRLEPREGVIIVSSFNDDKPLEVFKPNGNSVLVSKPAGHFHPMNPHLSPDGKMAVCMDLKTVKDKANGVIVWNQFDIQIIDLEAPAAKPKTIAEGVYNPSVVWSGDGRTIYYSHIDRDKLAESEAAGKIGSMESWAYNVTDGTKKQLKLPAHHKIEDVTPNGSMLLTSSITAQSHRQALFLTPSSTLTPDRDSVLEKSTLEKGFLFQARFSPDGKHLLMSGVFGDPSAQNPRAVVVVDLDTKKMNRLDLPKEILERGGNRLCWSPDGKRIAIQWEEKIPKPVSVPVPALPIVPGGQAGEPEWTASRVSVCDADGKNAKVIVHREYNETITGLDWR